MQHVTSLFDLTADDVRAVFDTASKIKTGFAQRQRPALLQGRVITQVFEKPSLRTRVSFSAAAAQLGGNSIFLSGQEAGLHGRESLADIARVLSGYSDAVVLRTFSQTLIEEFAQYSSCPVINGLSDDRHPCQALSDAFTIQEAFGGCEGRRLVYVGDGNNVAASLTIITSLIGMPMTLCTPPGYHLDPQFLADVQRRIPGCNVTTATNPRDAVQQADVVYTDVWASMGQESEADRRRNEFVPFQVNADLMAAAPSHCQFMHCLPAHRGDEVTDEVLDGPQSLAFQQAENRMHLAKGLLVWLLADDDHP